MKPNEEFLDLAAWAAVTDTDGKLVGASDRALAMADLTLADVADRSLADCEWFSQSNGDRDRVRDALAAAASGDIARREVVMSAKAGAQAVELTFLPRLDDNGRPAGILVTGIPATVARLGDPDEYVIEERMRQSARMETIGQLAGGVAHDFNNVLSVIVATADLLLSREYGDDSVREDLATILRACEQAASVTGRLLTLSRRQVMEPVVLDLNEVIADMAPLLERTLGASISVRARKAPDAVPALVDRSQIDQVLLNMALNSRDAMPRGGTLQLEAANVHVDELVARSHPGLDPGPCVVVSVSDTGCGMDEQTRKHIFEPFFTTKPSGKGTGLGLATAYGVIRQSGGSITVYSEPDQGTTFRIYLPRAASSQDGTAPAGNIPRGRETVLVVDDEQEIRQVATLMLEGRGYRVIAADSGAAALDVVKAGDESIDVVLCDVVMPGMNGPETIRRIRELAPAVRVLYMSGYTADLIAHQGIGEDSRRFLSKPFTLLELCRAIRKVLDR